MSETGDKQSVGIPEMEALDASRIWMFSEGHDLSTSCLAWFLISSDSVVFTVVQ